MRPLYIPLGVPGAARGDSPGSVVDVEDAVTDVAGRPVFSARTSAGRFATTAAPPTTIRPGAHNGGRVTPRGWRLLEQLESLFIEEGFAKFTLGALAGRLHCSRRTLYELAPNKDELAVVVVDRVLRRLGASAEKAARSANSHLDQLYIYMHTVALGFATASIAFLQDMQRTPAVQRVFDSHADYAMSLVERMIKSGVELGEFRPVQPAFVAQLLSVGLYHVLAPGTLETSGLSLGQALDELSAVFSHGLLAET